MTAIFYGSLTQTPTFFVRPVYYGGPMDGLVGYLIEADRAKGAQAYLRGNYVLRGYRYSCPTAAEAVYEWEPTR